MHRSRILTLLAAAFVAGCGDAQPAKETLSDKDKQQVQELNEQRSSEWGTTNVKKKK